MALAFLFYPKLLANYGLGAATAIMDGMFVNFVGFSLFLLFLALLHRYRQQSTSGRLVGLIVLATVVILSHTLTTISLFIAVLFYLLFNWRLVLIKKLIVIGTVAIGLSAFWLLPFIYNLQYSSPAVTAARNDYLFLLFPFNWLDFLAGRMFSLEWLAALAFFVGLLGFVLLLKKKQYLWPVYFLVTLFILPSQYLINFFPNWPLHYYRFFVFLYLILLACGSYGLAVFLAFLSQKKLWQVGGYTVLGLIIIYSLFHYNLSSGDGQINTLYTRLDDPYHFQLVDYPGIVTAEKVVDYLVSSSNVGRIFVEEPISDQGDLGSVHYFKTVLPLQGKEVIDGLYIEGAIQSPLSTVTIGALSNTFIWGDGSVYADPAFRLQDRDALLRRLAFLRVDTIVARSNKFKTALAGSSLVQRTNTINEYEFYQLAEIKPLVYPASFRPGIFFNESGDLLYRDLVKIWYKFPALLDYPVVKANNDLMSVDLSEIHRFGYVLVSAPSLTVQQLDRLASFTLPVIWLNGPKDITLPSELVSRIFFIDDFYNYPRATGVTKIVDQISKLSQQLNWPTGDMKKIEVLNWSEQKISYQGSGATIINIGYYPYWQATDQRMSVYQTTPASQILVWPPDDQQEVTLIYQPTLEKRVGQGLSIATVILMISYLFYRSYTKKRKVI